MKSNAAYRLRATASSPFKLLHANTIEMTPQHFLDLAMPFGHQGGPSADMEKVDRLSKLSSWDNNPMFSVKENAEGKLQVALHDGRHRALAAKKRGDSKLKVDIVRGRKYAREHPDTTDADMANMVVDQGLIGEVS